MQTPIIRIQGLQKRYASGFQALTDIDLDIHRGEILALLGPNGAGKTTLISSVCGIVRPTGGSVTVDGHDVATDPRRSRALIGLVPQELTTDAFETVWDTVSFSRGLFGLKADPAHIERVLRQLTLWDKRDSKLMTLSGGMKRRVMIAKALSHEPRILFLDEPTAGVDVELRRDMWQLVGELRSQGVTIILTTHYIEEAEAMADRVGIIARGRLLLVDQKSALMNRMGRRRLIVDVEPALSALPPALAHRRIEIREGGRQLVVTLGNDDAAPGAQSEVATLLRTLVDAGVSVNDLRSTQSSLEEIFVDLLGQAAHPDGGNAGSGAQTVNSQEAR